MKVDNWGSKGYVGPPSQIIKGGGAAPTPSSYAYDDFIGTGAWQIVYAMLHQFLNDITN